MKVTPLTSLLCCTDATRFKEAFEEAQRIIIENQSNSVHEDSDDGVGSSETEDEDDAGEGDEAGEKRDGESGRTAGEGSRASANEVTEKLGDLKVSDSVEPSGPKN